VREAIAFLLLACACGAALAERPAAPNPAKKESDLDPRAPSDRSGQADPSTSDGGTFAALEALAPSLAPGMRLAMEQESTGTPAVLVHAVDRDACVRVAFESTDPVIAKLVGGDGMILAQSGVPAPSGALGERGPVCIRKGDSVSAAADAAQARVRWIAWALP
jgi:hypothetical protein